MKPGLCMLAALLVTAGGFAAAGELDSGLAAPERLTAAGEPIDVDIGHAAPAFADFDGDGIRDLLVGQFGEGKLRIYRNEGSDSEPRFTSLAWFHAGDGLGKVPTG